MSVVETTLCPIESFLETSLGNIGSSNDDTNDEIEKSRNGQEPSRVFVNNIQQTILVVALLVTKIQVIKI